MHILIVTDQHPDTIGGAQVSIRVQQTFLERAGHRVTIVAPRLLNPGEAKTTTPGVIELPAMPITSDKSYGASWPGQASVRRVLRRLEALPPVTLVHVQGDFWGALIGYQLARRLNVPAVNTMHNNLDAGTRAVTPFAPAVFWALRAVRRCVLGRPRWPGRQTVAARRRPKPRGGWAYLAQLAADSNAVVAPSRHFAGDLERAGVPGPFAVIATGVHDDLVDEIKAESFSRGPGVRMLWCGRMSPEKRLFEMLEAFRLFIAAGGSAHLVVVGAGLQYEQAVRFVREHSLGDLVTFTGALSHEQTLAEIFRADVLVQTSRGFETQGMTPYEAALLGTPTLYCDANIASAVDVAPAWIEPSGSAQELAAVLATAATEIASGAPGEMRVPELLTEGMRQSSRTEEMLEVYRALCENA
ncbi:glycosyltransferase [Leucobacter chinensis]|uniref:glycosyltransferase n=1 Tax=Leucobacter chinensis TaxID=2851010 RepID=UPI001C2324E2